MKNIGLIIALTPLFLGCYLALMIFFNGWGSSFDIVTGNADFVIEIAQWAIDRLGTRLAAIAPFLGGIAISFFFFSFLND